MPSQGMSGSVASTSWTARGVVPPARAMQARPPVRTASHSTSASFSAALAGSSAVPTTDRSKLRMSAPRVRPAAGGAMVRFPTMAVEALEPNRILAGRYRLEARLGQGGMGAIWRAEHLVLQAPVAVKLIDREAVPDEDTLTRFL